MSDELDVLKLVATRLGAAGIPYMLSGSMAMNYYAQPRMTRDIDLVVELEATDADRFATLFSPDFYCDAEAVYDAIARQTMFNIIHTERVVKVDCIVRKGTPYRRTEFSRRRAISLEEVTVWVVTAEDLLLSKLHWAKDTHSELQLGDARNIVAAVADLDWSYLHRWAEELSVSPLLSEICS
jgi:hypothetical protein